MTIYKYATKAVTRKRKLGVNAPWSNCDEKKNTKGDHLLQIKKDFLEK